MKVLVVDDATFMRATIKKILEKNCTRNIVEAVNGKDAIAKYKNYNPDLVIMDISMPIMNGIEAVKEIKKINKDAMIIICSLLGQRSNVLEAIKAGAKSFLVKPIKEDKLMAEINKLSPALVAECHEHVSSELIESIAEATEEDLVSMEYLRGIGEGYLECKREIATNMVYLGLDMEIITRCVELTEEEVKEFADEYNYRMELQETITEKDLEEL